MKNYRHFLGIFPAILLSMVSFLHAFSYPAGSFKNINLVTVPAADLLSSSITNITICNNQLPYHWNGLTCLIAGTYSATLTGSSGSDSIAVLNLSVINVGTSITNAIVCDNELPYHWNGNSYSTNGTYSVTLTSSSGCDSVPILSLTVNHIVTSTTNRTICSDQLPYNWNGNNYPAAGAYTITLTSAAGCDSLATLNLTVNPVSSSASSIIICNNQLPYHWNGNSYPSAGTYSLTLVNSKGCDSVASLTLSVVPVVTSNSFVTVCNNELPYSWNGNNYSSAGNYNATLTSSSGCDSIATLHLTVIATATSTTTVKICDGQLPYSWNGNSYPASGNYPVTLTSSIGCDSIATLRLISVSFLSSSTNHAVCNSQLPYNWNGIDYSVSGTYTASFITAAGCDSIATLNLEVETPQVSTDSILICENALPYNWHGNIYADAGTYRINPPLNIDACHAIDTLVLIVQVIIPTSTAVTVCSNHLPYTWNGNDYSTTGIYGITLSSSAGCDSLTSLDLTVVPTGTSTTDISTCSNHLPYNWNGNNYNTSGVYPVTLVSANGCDSIATLNLTVNNVASGSTDITACSTQLPYNWNGNNYSTNGTYIVTLTNSGGCDSIATLHFTVLPFLTSTTNITVCSSQLPYNWSGNNYSAAGTYPINLTSSAGCDSVATLNLVVNDVITSTTNINTCSSQLPYSWNGNSYPSGGTYSITLVTSAGCDSVATLNLIVSNTSTSITDIIICNNQLPYSWNGNSYPVGGVYPVTLTSSGGCDSIATLNLQVTDILTSTTNVNVCPLQLPYQWNGNSYPTGGTYSVTLSNAAGCDSVPILSLTVVPYVTSSTDIAICNNQLPYNWNGNSYPVAGTYSVLLSGTSFCDSLATLNLAVVPAITSTTIINVCNNQLPYTWNGAGYNSTGLYTASFITAGGCDSIATLDLHVNATATSNTAVMICSSQLPYSWNGNTYPSAGTFSLTLTSASGCDSIATLNLAANDVVTSTTTIAICSSQLPYNWNGNSYPLGGSYSITLTSSAGCDSIATLNLAATTTVTSTTNISTCENELPYNWNGNNYPEPGIYSITLTSTGGCDSVAILNLIANPLVTSTTNITTCNNQLPYNWNGQSFTTAGTYAVTLLSAAGCDSVATLNLIVNQVTTSTTIAGTCSNQLPYSWNGENYLVSGNYSVTLTGAGGCDSIANLRLTVNPVTTSMSNASTCSNELPFIWNGQNYNTAGLHTITLTGSSGCDSIATLDLIINPTPPVPSVISPVSYCQYEITTALSATVTTAGNHLIWYNSSSGGTGSLVAPIPPSLIPGSMNYYVSQADGICEGPRALITVKVNSKPGLGPDKSLKICFGKSANLSELFNTTGFTSNWSIDQLTLTNPSVVTVAGTYQLIIQNNSGCADTAFVDLSIQPPVIADAGNDADAEYNAPYQLSGSGGGNYTWSPANVLNNPFVANPLAVLTENTTFILMVTDDAGCAAFDTVKLRVLKGPTFYVPSAFTPNGDGLNDIFKPTPVGIASLDFFRIFNRYGELVFETHEIGKGWDGTYKGLKQNIGNYVWSLSGMDRLGKLKVMKGNVVLIR